MLIWINLKFVILTVVAANIKPSKWFERWFAPVLLVLSRIVAESVQTAKSRFDSSGFLNSDHLTFNQFNCYLFCSSFNYNFFSELSQHWHPTWIIILYGKITIEVVCLEPLMVSKLIVHFQNKIIVSVTLWQQYYVDFLIQLFTDLRKLCCLLSYVLILCSVLLFYVSGNPMSKVRSCIYRSATGLVVKVSESFEKNSYGLISFKTSINMQINLKMKTIDLYFFKKRLLCFKLNHSFLNCLIHFCRYTRQNKLFVITWGSMNPLQMTCSLHF